MDATWAATGVAEHLTPIGAAELAAASIPLAPRRTPGYDRAATDVLLGRSLLALRVAEEQLADLQAALAAARAAASLPAPPGDDPGIAAAVERWLDQMPPDRIERLVSDLAARQIVDATIYAEATRREARDRISVMVDLLAESAAELDRMVAAARGSLAGQHRLEADLPSWQGRFHAAVSGAFATLDLPASEKVRALVAVVTKDLAGT